MLSKKSQKLVITLFKELLKKNDPERFTKTKYAPITMHERDYVYFYNDPFLTPEILKCGFISKSKIYSVLKALEIHGILGSYTVKKFPKAILTDKKKNREYIKNITKNRKEFGIPNTFTTQGRKQYMEHMRKAAQREARTDFFGTKAREIFKTEPFFWPYSLGPKTKAYYFTPFGINFALNLCLADGEDLRPAIVDKMFVDTSSKYG